MTTIALVGLAENTRAAVRESKADEIWTMNWSYKYDFIPRIDRLFEMHPVWLYAESDKAEHVKMRDHWAWLQKPRPYPVYMLRKFPMQEGDPVVPDSISYPIGPVTDYCFQGMYRGLNPADFYGSSFDYMMALAIYEKVDVIELYGMEMGSLTEYRYQRETAAFFVGLALAHGIKVKLQPNSVLLRSRRYGYEGGQMVFRQDLERMLTQFVTKREEAMGKLQYFEGQAALVPDDEEIAAKLKEARDDALIASGGEQCLAYIIQFIDLDEPMLELQNPIRIVPIEQNAE